MTARPVSRRTAPVAISVVVALAFSAGAFAQKKPDKEKAKDPVCGMIVDKDPKLWLNHDGQTHYFCSKADMEEFKNPSQLHRAILRRDLGSPE